MWRSLLNRNRWDVTRFGDLIGQTIHRVHRSSPIDVIEIEESFGWFQDVARLNPGIPVVVKLHGPTFLVERGDRASLPFVRDKIGYEGMALRTAKVLVAPSTCTLEDTLEHYALSPVLTQRLPNPLITDGPLELWSPEKCDKDTVLFIGRFDKIKGADTVLKVFRRLLDIRPTTKLVFVGPDIGIRDPDGAVIQFEAYSNRLFSPQEKAHISFLGKLPPSSLQALRRQALLTLMTSVWESQSYTVLEALLQGCPLVAVNAGGVGEIVENGVSGWLTGPDDVEGLTTRILQVMDDLPAAQTMGLKGRAYVLANHSPETVVRQNLEVYRQAIALA
ncbi:hypothetical protein LPB72_10750 [Hydrogenophaga crassostreae]|uniref:Glycosyl transferase family 1 domain-containing protein n=2 Tax=Hydrogenophaga crassostreae TaxID=1763535 RepID=A0A167HVA5_9BURK|nr:hypothetical protein LPB072_12125 [Hydrogenophaga crassostreae]OAD41783.1 hypothetical protein LPB72_10750 [Hydrogenophaga crassostreae]